LEKKLIIEKFEFLQKLKNYILKSLKFVYFYSRE
jgi:hypothetical protein